jgi:exopolyphosphatase/guanosine-5'-triphosphate,3'-diphosphate pyrophosphatase
MIVGELRHGQLSIIDRLRETVRLSEGLTASGELAEPAKRRAIDCLSRFGERLRDMHASSVRAAGTNALRRARNSETFMAEAEAALGQPIEIISGIEEARLIYKGVTHSLPPADGLRLVLDIGGGSTELILGQGSSPIALESLHLGCVAMTERFFENGRITKPGFDKARTAASLELRPVKAFFRDSQDVEAIGTSGTIIATEAVARGLQIIESNRLTPHAVEALIEKVIEFEDTAALTLPGLSERRAQVWPGGLAILVELLNVLHIDSLQISDGALREGLLYDHLGRLQHEDARERSVRAMASRYNVDEAQANRVASTANELLAQCADTWNLTSALAKNILTWASQLHEIGLDISHDGYQRHGAYVAENADLPGFPRIEQSMLAFLIANQRRELATATPAYFTAEFGEQTLRLALLLRLAVLLNRSRSSVELPHVNLEVGQHSMDLKFPGGWLADNPLTVADLEREQEYLRSAGVTLDFE